MVKLVAAFAVLGALAAGVFLVPIRGRTIADRWHAAPGPAAFAKNAWDESRAAVDDDRPADPAPSALRVPANRRSRPSGAARRAPAPAPAEHHTAEDRAALDRLLSERSR